MAPKVRLPHENLQTCPGCRPEIESDEQRLKVYSLFISRHSLKQLASRPVTILLSGQIIRILLHLTLTGHRPQLLSQISSPSNRCVRLPLILARCTRRVRPLFRSYAACGECAPDWDCATRFATKRVSWFRR